jgi:Ran GTPase-activating protein (RanGAP) involved in mRNA processing and transport
MNADGLCFTGEMALESKQQHYGKMLSDPSVMSINVLGQDFDKETETLEMLLHLLSIDGRRWNTVKLSSCRGRVNILVEAILKSKARKLILMDEPLSLLPSLSKGLQTNSSLLILGLQSMNFTTDDIDTLCLGLHRNNNVMEILFDRSSFIDDGSHIALGRVLKECSSLQHLSFQDCCLNDDQCAIICDSLVGHGSIMELNLEGNSCTSAGMRALAAVLKHTNLLVLDLSAQTLQQSDSLDLTELSNALSSSRIRYLQLSDNRLDDYNILSLATGVKENNSLRILNMAWCSLSSNAIANLSDALCFNSTLSNLNLFGCGICDQGMTKLASSLSRMQGLKKLDLGGQQGYTENGITTFLMGMGENMNLEETLLNSVRLDRDRFFFDANRGGRRFLRSQHTSPVGLWPLIIKRVQDMDLPKSCDPWATDPSQHIGFDESEEVRRAAVLFYLLRNGVVSEL